MDEFTATEIEEAIMAARIFNESYGHEQFHALRELEKRLQDSNYVEVVAAVARFEKERGIHCTKVLDAVEQLLRDSRELEQKIADRAGRLQTVENNVRLAEDKLHQVEEATEQAKAEHKREQEDLATFRKKAKREKQRIDRELEEYRQKANVTREEISSSSKLKEQLVSRGLTIEFTSDLLQEFVGHENARQELATALKERQTLTRYIADLNERAKEQKEALESERSNLQLDKDRRHAEIRNLDQARNQLANMLSQLQADVTHEEELRRFYQRYYGWSGLLEWLASWNHIFFLRCNNPVYAMTGALVQSAAGAHVWTDKAGPKCPHCGLDTLVYDERLYQAVQWPVGQPLKLQLGE